MGCVASKLEEEEEVVSICRERKQKIKLAVDKRHALAQAHWRYTQSLYAVSASINLFVACHSSPSAPFLITFPPPCSSSSSPCENQNVITNPMFLQQMPSESTCQTVDCGSCASSTSSSDSEEQEEEEDEDEEEDQEQEQEREVIREQHHQPCGYFYMQMPPPSMPSPRRDFGWDFFNPFDNVNRPEVINGYRHNLDDEVLRVVREEEGIPELEEEENKVAVAAAAATAADEDNEEKRVENGTTTVVNEVTKIDEGTTNLNQVEPKGLTVIDTPVEGRELLEALKDIEDYFQKAYQSLIDVSRMLEANVDQMQSGLEEIKENSTKLIQSARHRSISSKPSSCKSLVVSTSKSSSSWTEFRNDLFDDYGGMAAGSHSLTLGRIYAWEKKLYEEVKAGDSTRKLYEKKCSRLRNLDVRGDDELTMDKTRATVKDLYARILVAIRSAESISIKIEKLRDEELLPQIVELLKGLTRTWKLLLESHETQNKILIEVKTFTCSAFGKFSNESHQAATVQLKVELNNWRACFVEYVSAQKAYVEALHGWLTKFIVPEVEFYSRSKGSAVSCRVNGPPLLMICHDWLASIEKLPDKSVAFALKSFAKDVKALFDQQCQEQLQKRKVDSLAKELDRRVVAFQKTEGRFLELKLTENNESDAENRNEYLTEKKDQLDMLRRRLDVEKEKHHNLMLETQRMTLNGFQTGFCTVFESLIEFSKASQNMYNDLVNDNENSEKTGNMSYIEDTTKVEQNSSQMKY
ncbi:protein ALTERED PHOSPHATE STARVATION RESPONSE 1 [Cannabis sativa]|uniref:protein ALTERED PHOSPHATE STARVATION RESPONSE 1 n=1 Tax=Cannabis sativa TaxID=3483 RepID=UPI0029CA5CDA|nr:protein ALTERED PHOSPHATE STARVATION RESPONSE 1 [Cannabis sativa]